MKQVFRPMLLAAVVVATLGASAGAFAQSGSTTPPKVDKAKASYVVGWQIATRLPPLVREHIDPAIVASALKDALSGKKPTMSNAEFESVGKAFMAELQSEAKAKYAKAAEENETAGKAFMAKHRKDPGVHVTSSGLQYKVLKKGTGPRPGKDDVVQVDYVGSFLNGEKFDASAAHPNPKGGKSMPVSLANVIPGFREGLQLMQVGGHYQFWIPSNLAYGTKPRNGFPPNATLVFDVQLEGTKPPPPGGNANN